MKKCFVISRSGYKLFAMLISFAQSLVSLTVYTVSELNSFAHWTVNRTLVLACTMYDQLNIFCFHNI